MTKFVTPQQLKELKTLLQCDMKIKGETPLQEYRAAIQRYNTVFIKRAVRFAAKLLHVLEAKPPQQQVIIFVESEQHVSIAIKFVTANKIDFAVAGGRHSYQGASSTDAVVIGKAFVPDV
jgi:hypothetical protein